MTGSTPTTVTRGDVIAVLVAVVVYLVLAVPAVVLLFGDENLGLAIALLIVAHGWALGFSRWIRARQEERSGSWPSQSD